MPMAAKHNAAGRHLVLTRSQLLIGVHNALATQAGHHKTCCCSTGQKLLQRKQGIPPVVEVNLVIRLHGELLLKTIGSHSLHPCQGF